MTEQTFPSYKLYLPDHIQGPTFLYNSPYATGGADVSSGAIVPCGETDESGLGIDPKITYVDSKNAQFTHPVRTSMSEQGFDVKGVLMHANMAILQDFLAFPINQLSNTPATDSAFGVNTVGLGEPSDTFNADMAPNYEPTYKTWFLRMPSPGFASPPTAYGNGSVFNPHGRLGFFRIYKGAIIARTFKPFTHKSEFTCSFTLRAYIDDTVAGGSKIGKWVTYQPKILT